MSDAMAVANEVARRQQRTEQDATSALREARQALEDVQHLTEVAVTRAEHDGQMHFLRARRERNHTISIAVIALLMLGVIVGGFLLHRADTAAAQARQAAADEKTNTAELKGRLVKSCENRNHATDVQREYYRRLLFSYQQDTSLPPAAQTARLGAIHYVMSSLPPNTNCLLLAK